MAPGKEIQLTQNSIIANDSCTLEGMSGAEVICQYMHNGQGLDYLGKGMRLAGAASAEPYGPMVAAALAARKDVGGLVSAVVERALQAMREQSYCVLLLLGARVLG